MNAKLATRLVEPDYWTCPHGKRTRPESVLTFGPEVADLCAKANFAPDTQQELGLDLIFAIKPDGSPASFEFCVICCRQNLKTGLFKQAAIGWLFVTEQPLIVWSAHEMSTTNEAQRDLGNLMMDSPILSKWMMSGDNHGIYHANGDERIELRTGQRIMFKARTRDGGRGLSAPKLILDEAFALKASMMGSLLPLMMAQVDPQVIYGSSAGKADSDVLFDIRERGRSGASPRMSYIEWLAPREDCKSEDCKHPKDAIVRDLDCALDREHLIRAGNPTITTGRIQIETVRDLRQALPPAEYMRECFGWWDEFDAHEQVIPLKAWTALTIPDEEVPLDPPAYYALAMSPDRIASIAVAVRGVLADYVDLAEMSRVDDSRKLIDWFVTRCGRRIPVMIDSRDPAASMVNELRSRGVKVNVSTATDAAKACGGLLDAVKEARVQHCDQPAIRVALVSAKKKLVGKAGLWEWDLEDLSPEMAALRAITLARFGLSFKKRPSGNGRSNTSGRRAVLL